MTEGEFPGVEHLAGIIAGAFAAVEFVAEDGVAEVMQMHSDLVGPGAVQDAFDEADVVPGTENAVFGFRRAALAQGDAHPLAMDGMAGDGFVDHAGSLAQGGRESGQHLARVRSIHSHRISKVIFPESDLPMACPARSRVDESSIQHGLSRQREWNKGEPASVVLNECRIV
jgi:hypothetical protein